MEQLIWYAWCTLAATILSTTITIMLLRRNNKFASEIIQTRILSIREEVQALLDTEFERFRPLISRSMTLAANAGAQVKKTQAFEKQMIETIQEDLPITPDMVRAFSPALGDMVDENPRLLVTAAQVIQKIMGGQGLLDIGNARRPAVDRRPEI